MGLFGHGGDGGRRFVMREKLLSVGDDFWIQDDGGDKVYKVNGKALRARKTFVLEDPAGNEVAHIQDRVVAVRGKMEIERNGESLATVHKAIVGIRDRFDIDVDLDDVQQGRTPPLRRYVSGRHEKEPKAAEHVINADDKR